MEHGVFKNIDLKLSTNFIYRRILLLLFILFIALAISYGFLIYQVRIISLKKTEKYTVFQERELYVSKFYNSFNTNELIQELYSVTNDSKYLSIRKDNLENMRREFDSLYWYCRESDEYCLRLDSSRFYLNLYLGRLIPESDSILNKLRTDRSGYIDITKIKPDTEGFRIDTIRLHASKKDELMTQLSENLDIIEKRIMNPTQWIVRSDRNELRANQKIVDERIRLYHFWQKVVVSLVLGVILLLVIVLIFILSRPLEKPRPIYNTLPNQQYSAIYDNFENELTEIIQNQKELFLKYLKIILVFPKGSFFPIQIISAFQKFTHESDISFQVHDKLNTENLEVRTAYVLLEDKSLAALVEAVSKTNMIIGEQIGILAYGDNPLKRIVANGITVIDNLFQDCEHTGFRHMKATSKKCLQFIRRNSL
jgi:hypothetical protein